MAEAGGVGTAVHRILTSSIMASVISPPFSLARDFCREPRWSMAAAAMMPRSLETFLRPASLPGVSFMRILLNTNEDECLEVPNIVNLWEGKSCVTGEVTDGLESGFEVGYAEAVMRPSSGPSGRGHGGI